SNGSFSLTLTLGIQDVPSLVYRLQRASANIASTLVLRVADVNALPRGLQSPLIEKRWSVAGPGD
ncbi:MAG: hypothetical protein KKB56_17020, partial [Gammaproteobacteria bacterium]|nr:hypothetical protein [Gammaproteobacteria bacterium]